MSLIIPANSLAGGGYEIDNSLRFNSGSSDNLTITPASASNRKTWTFSTWIKRSNISNNQSFFTARTDGSNYFTIRFEPDDLHIFDLTSSSFAYQIKSSALYRDVSAWYHIVVAFDTTQATSSNRVRIYVNGSEITAFATASYPSLNADGYVNNTVSQQIGMNGSSDYLDGYLSEIHLIDGQALTPTDFGEFDADSGVWKPIAYSGTYGTNGFFLEFQDSGALGTDSSGEGNNFTVNNLTSIDQTTDTPTNNFTLLNTLNYSSSTRTYGEGNTAITASGSGDWNTALNNIGVRSGKWYAEFKINSVGSYSAIGVVYQQQPVPFPNNPTASLNYTFLVGEDTGSAGWRNNGDMPQGGTIGTYTTNDILMIAMDLDNDKLYFGKNGTWENSGVPTSGATGTGSILNLTANQDYYFVISPRGGSTYCNFGNPAFTIASGNTDANDYGNFEYAVPAGYYALNTKNLAEYG
jgi:hypothetical protein